MNKWIRIGMLYFVLGIGIGIYIGINQLFHFKSFHAHINLLGWVSMGIIGIIYASFPKLNTFKTSPIIFWIYQVSVLLFLTGHILVSTPNATIPALPFLIIGGNGIFISIVLLAINLHKIPLAKKT